MSMSTLPKFSEMSDAEVGATVIGYTILAIKYSVMLAAWWYCGWFVALLLCVLTQLLTAAAAFAAAAMISEDSFESVGRTTGRAIGSVMNLFSRKG